MNIQYIGMTALGVLFIFLSLKSFVLYLKGGAFGINVNNPIGPSSMKHKAHGEKGEEVLLLRNAVGFIIFGVALCYWGLSNLLVR